MAAENFKVKKGLEVGTGATITSDGIDVSGIITATQFKGDGSQLIGVTAAGAGVLINHDDNNIGVAGTINFSNNLDVSPIHLGIVTITALTSGISSVAVDTTPQLGGNLNLNSKNITGSGNIDIAGNLKISGVSTFSDDVFTGVGVTVGIGSTVFFGDNIKAVFGDSGDLKIQHNTTVTPHVSQITNRSDSELEIVADNLELRSGTGDKSYLTASVGSGTTLFHNGTVKLTTTSNGIEVGNMHATGVSTVGRLDALGVTLGANNNSLAAQFVDDAVANFGTDHDLKISHDDTHARITNTTGDIVVSGIISATSDVKVGSAITMDPTSGIITATSFSGSGANLTNIPSAQLTGALPALDGSALIGVTASGTGVIIEHDGTAVGTAGTINFSTNLDVTNVSAGVVTVTSSGGGGGIATMFTVTANNLTDETVYPIFVGVATGSQGAESDTNLSYNPNDNKLTAGTFSGNLDGTVETAAQTNITSLGTLSSLTVSGNITANGNIVGDNSTNISGIASVTATSFHGSGIGLTSLDASNLGIGTIPNGRFPAILPAVSGENLTSLNADQITTGTISAARIDDDAITSTKIDDGTIVNSNISSSAGIAISKLDTLTANTIIGRHTSNGTPQELTATQVRTILNVADGANVGVTTARWTVINTGGGASSYSFTGPGGLSAATNATLYLARGQTYEFNMNASGHGFGIQTSSGTWNASNEYSTGITNAKAAVGIIKFEVPFSAPNTLYYACTSGHSGMVGTLVIYPSI